MAVMGGEIDIVRSSSCPVSSYYPSPNTDALVSHSLCYHHQHLAFFKGTTMSSSEPATTPAAPMSDDEKKKFEEDHNQFVGSANFEAAKAKAGGLSELEHTEEGQKWLKVLVPKDDEEGSELAAKRKE
jgi:hypothetical protein